MLSVALVGLIAFGIILETRTALRRVPMTDLGVFSCASWAAWHGENIYDITDWHGWHYQYPPALAILFIPLSHPLPQPVKALEPGEARTAANTPWGQGIAGKSFFGLHRENLRFFVVVGIWYVVSVALAVLSVHALASILERRKMSAGPPIETNGRIRWWCLRVVGLLGCIVSIGTDLSRGQVDILMLGAISLALYLVCNGRQFSGGMVLAFPATVKLFPPLLLIYPFWRRQWFAAAGVIVGLVFFLLILPALTLGVPRTSEVYRNWFNVLAKPALGKGTDQSRAKELTGMNSTDNQSLLAFIHNWHFRALPVKERPKEANPAERYITYAVGAVLVIGVLAAAGVAKKDEPRELLLTCGLLVGLALVISPIVHNYYYLLMLPTLIAMADAALAYKLGEPANWRLLSMIIVFGVVDTLTRMPGIGRTLRDLGLPVLVLLCVLFTSAVLLVAGRRKAAAPG